LKDKVKNTPKELFELRVMTDNPLFEGFALTKSPSLLGRDSLDDDLTPGFGVSESSRNWTQVSLRDKWMPPRVVGRVAPYNDFPGIDMVLPAFSLRACEALSDLLEPNGELLPILSHIGQYFFYNITAIVDALDTADSECEFWCDPPTTATEINYFSFHESKLAGLSIFRIHEWPMGAIVSNQFVERVHAHRLNGFDFVKIWPYKRGTDWRMEGEKRRRRIDAGWLKRHTLVLILPLGGVKLNSTEEQAIKRLEDELDVELAVSSLNAPFFGRYEGSDKVQGEFRMFVSCPDVDLLEQKLVAWLDRLNWPRPVVVMKRYGKMRDPSALETVRRIPAE
jgi:hypothetical protein